jgi:hypothetical protein
MGADAQEMRYILGQVCLKGGLQFSDALRNALEGLRGSIEMNLYRASRRDPGPTVHGGRSISPPGLG